MAMMTRQSSSVSLLLLDTELDYNGDVFDPPAWRPGRYLQFADISIEDEPSVRPVSLHTERMAASLGESAEEPLPPSNTSTSFGVQLDAGRFSSRHCRLTRQTAIVMTSCMTVALTALTFLTFAL